MLYNPYIDRSSRQHSHVVPYNPFIAAVILLSIVNLVLYIFIKNDALITAIQTIDVGIRALFFIDFVRLLVRSEHKWRYITKEFNWG